MRKLLFITGYCFYLAAGNWSAAYALPAQQKTASYYEALQLMDQRRGREALVILKSFADQGKIDAYFQMGHIYRFGIDMAPDLDKAVQQYREASNRGHDQASQLLANILYFDFANTPGAQQEAVALWKAQAVKGDGQAFYMLGSIFWNGEAGMTADPILAYGLMWEASRKRVPGADDLETSMREDMDIMDRMQGQRVVSALGVKGFPASPLKSVNARAGRDDELYVTRGPAEGLDKRQPPADWNKSWRILIGGHVSKTSANRLRSEIVRSLPGIVGDLAFSIVPAHRPRGDRDHLLLAGPFKDNYEGLLRCSYLKRYEYSCESQGPQ